MRLCGLIKSLESFLLVGRGILWWDFEIQVVIYNPIPMASHQINADSFQDISSVFGQAYPESKQKETVRKNQMKIPISWIRDRRKQWEQNQIPENSTRSVVNVSLSGATCSIRVVPSALRGQESHTDCVDTITSKDTSTSFSPNTSSKKTKRGTWFLDTTSNDNQTFLWMILKIRHQENQIVTGILLLP